MSLLAVEYGSSEWEIAREMQVLPDSVMDGVENARGRLTTLGQRRQASPFGGLEEPRTPKQVDALIPTIRRINRELIKSLRPFKRRDGTWQQALENCWSTVAEAVQQEGSERFYVFRILMGAGVASGVALRAGEPYDGVRAIGFEVMRDARPELSGENPFSHILSLEELNPVRMGFRQVLVEGAKPQERLFVDFPLKLEGYGIKEEDGWISACLSFPTRGAVDRRMSYAHTWMQDCSQARPFNPVPPRIVVA